MDSEENFNGLLHPTIYSRSNFLVGDGNEG